VLLAFIFQVHRIYVCSYLFELLSIYLSELRWKKDKCSFFKTTNYSGSVKNWKFLQTFFK